MSLEVTLSEHHEGMLADLREAHGDEIDNHLQAVVEAEIHESYQQLDRE